MTHRSALTRTFVAMAIMAALVVFRTSDAAASFHLNKISEVYAGSQADSQFIELQMFSSNQNFVSGQQVTVYDASGTEVGVFTFTNNMANGQNQRHILIATAAAEQEFGVQADLEMSSAAIPRAGGKACFANVDCVSWGSYSGSSTQPSPTGTPFGAASGLPDAQSIARDISGGSNPNTLEGSDDTNDSAADFDAATPTPTNNVGEGPQPTTTPSTSPSPTPAPSPCSPAVSFIVIPADSETYKASKARSFSGDVTCTASQVEVALQKKLRSGKCHWWEGDRFVKRACSSKLFVLAEGTDEWTYDLGRRLTSSFGTKTKHYTAYSRATSETDGGQETSFDRGRNANRFEIK